MKKWIKNQANLTQSSSFFKILFFYAFSSSFQNFYFFYVFSNFSSCSNQVFTQKFIFLEKMDQNDPSAYRLVSLNDGAGEVRIVNKHNVSRGIIVGNSGSTDEINTSNLPSLSEPSGQKVFINNQGNRIYSKTESRGSQEQQQQPSNNSASSPNNKSSNSPNAAVNAAGGSEFKNPRDDARRKQHNEVERRRRDKINTWIARLAKIVPECSDEAKSSQSKGGICERV